jgi:hypothetical protein
MFVPARAIHDGPRRVSWNRHAKNFWVMAHTDLARSAALRIVPRDFPHRG